MDEIDYALFQNLESYLFRHVGPRFQASHQISAVDFYIIMAWKANRSKNKGRDRLKLLGGSFDEAVASIAAALAFAEGNKERLRCLMIDWRFRLPIASAILSVLYPEEFTIYDVRVCAELKDFTRMGDRMFSDNLWAEYERFLEAVHAAVPHKRSLREKDHFLWGRSFHKSAVRDCAA